MGFTHSSNKSMGGGCYLWGCYLSTKSHLMEDVHAGDFVQELSEVELVILRPCIENCF